jgi:hypothetical protein
MAEDFQVGVDRVFITDSSMFRHLVKSNAANYEAVCNSEISDLSFALSRCLSVDGRRFDGRLLANQKAGETSFAPR